MTVEIPEKWCPVCRKNSCHFVNVSPIWLSTTECNTPIRCSLCNSVHDLIWEHPDYTEYGKRVGPATERDVFIERHWYDGHYHPEKGIRTEALAGLILLGVGVAYLLWVLCLSIS